LAVFYTFLWKTLQVGLKPGQTAIAKNISQRCRWFRWVKGFTFSKGETFLASGTS